MCTAISYGGTHGWILLPFNAAGITKSEARLLQTAACSDQLSIYTGKSH